MTAATLTPKQERFAQKYLETGNAAEAYRQAYDAGNMKPVTVRRKAAELLEHGNVSARVRELQDAHLRRHNVTVAALIDELQEARVLARDLAQPNTMVSATMGKAKICGLVSDAAVNVSVVNRLGTDDKAILDEYAGKAD